MLPEEPSADGLGQNRVATHLERSHAEQSAGKKRNISLQSGSRAERLGTSSGQIYRGRDENTMCSCRVIYMYRCVL